MTKQFFLAIRRALFPKSSIVRWIIAVIVACTLDLVLAILVDHLSRIWLRNGILGFFNGAMCTSLFLWYIYPLQKRATKGDVIDLLEGYSSYLRTMRPEGVDTTNNLFILTPCQWIEKSEYVKIVYPFLSARGGIY